MIKLQQSYTQKRRQAKEDQQKIAKMALVTSVRGDLDKFRQKTPDRKTLSIQVGNLYEVLNRYPVSVDKITFKPEKDEILSMWRYSANIVIRGKYPFQKKVLAEIQSLSNLYVIDNVIFAKGPANSDKLELKIRITIYLT